MKERTFEGKVLEDDGTVIDSIPAWVVLIDVGLGDGDGVGDVVQPDIVVFDVLGDTLSADPRLHPRSVSHQLICQETRRVNGAHLEPSPVQGIDHRDILCSHPRRAIRPCQMKASPYTVKDISKLTESDIPNGIDLGLVLA